MNSTFFKTNTLTLFLRLLLIYGAYFICRVVFTIYNHALLDPITLDNVWGIARGSLVFDSISIFYVNIPFIVFSLLPTRQREKGWYSQMLFWLFISTNAVALVTNVADIFYYEFKAGRLASDDAHYLGEGNAAELMLQFLRDYWWGGVLYVALLWLIVVGYRHIPTYKIYSRHKAYFYISSIVVLPLSILLSVAVVRGWNLSHGAFPLTMQDAMIYVDKPSHSALVLSNPFCLIRTAGKQIRHLEYTDSTTAERLYPTTICPATDTPCSHTVRPKTNVVIIILESFASAHIKSFGGDPTGFTPFIDSLAAQSLVFTNAYHNGIRSRDALPAIWGSIPSFELQFLSLPQSLAKMRPLPEILREEGYSTAFLHGAGRKSLSMASFAKSSGVEHTYSREEYESERGTNDYDGQWGIWDHKFLDYAAEKIAQLREPYLATIFTLSSHAPFILPSGMESLYPEGTLPIDKMLRYSDDALRTLFARLSRLPSFDNTLFILTADHGSGASTEKFRHLPYSFSVPIIFYQHNNPSMRGREERVTGHIDIMPTLLGMMQYRRPVFSFGRNVMHKSPSENFTINYFGGAYNIITPTATYLFDGERIVETIPTAAAPQPDTATLNNAKSLLQQYYSHLDARNFCPCPANIHNH